MGTDLRQVTMYCADVAHYSACSRFIHAPRPCREPTHFSPLGRQIGFSTAGLGRDGPRYTLLFPHQGEKLKPCHGYTG